MSTLFTLPSQIPFQNSAPLGLAKLYFYRAGTTAHQPVYTTAALSTPHDQPVRSYADGTLPPIYLNPSASYDYRLQIKTADEALIDNGDIDNIPKSGYPSQSEIGLILYPRTPAEIAASVTPVNYAYQYDLPERLGAINDNSTVSTTAFQNIVTTNKHGAVRLSEGTGYLVRNEVQITGRTHVKGVGIGSTIVFNPTSNNLRLFYGTNLDNVTFSDFAISGNVGSATGKIGLDFMKSGSDLVSRLKVDNIYFDSLLYSINREEAQHDVVRDCRFLNSGALQSGIAMRYVTYLNHGTLDNNDFRGQDMCLRVHGGIAVTLYNNTSEENGTSGGTISSQFYFSDVTSITIDVHYGEADRTGAAGGVFRFDNCGVTTLRGMDLHGDIGGTTYSAYFFEFVTPEADVVIESCTLSEIITGFVKVTTNTNNKIIRMKGCTFIDGGSELTTYAAIMAKMSDPTSIELTDIPHLETYNPASLSDGEGVTTTFAVTGVVLGDVITVSFSLDLQGATMTGFVQSAGNVSVRFQNESGGVLDLGSGTIRVFVHKR